MAVLILGLPACDGGAGDAGKSRLADTGPAMPASPVEGLKDVAKVGAPKASDADVPIWAQDTLGCEGQALPEGGGRDEAVGLKVGMTEAAVRAALKCYQISTVYSAGNFYSPDSDGQAVAIDAFLLSAKREHEAAGELVEVMLAGPPQDRRAFQVSYVVRYGGPPERLPSVAAVTAAMQAQYGPLDGLNTYWHVTEDSSGRRLTLNSPAQLRCNRPTDVSCGRRVVVAYSAGPNGTVAQRNITLNDGRIAKAVLAAAPRR